MQSIFATPSASWPPDIIYVHWMLLNTSSFWQNTLDGENDIADHENIQMPGK